MANPKKISPGSRLKRFPAGTFNALVEGEIRDRQAAHRNNPPPPSGFAKSSIIVRLWWQGESPLPPGSVVKLGEVIKEPTDKPWVVSEGLQFTCEEPTSADSEEPCAITLEPIPAGGLGCGHIPQATWALVNVSDAGHEFAKVDDGTELISDASAGFPIIWKESGTGAGKWAVVSLSRPGGTGVVKVVITGNVSAASYSSGTLTPTEFTARLWMADGDNWTQSADDTKDCTNPYLTAIAVTSGSGRLAWVTTAGELVTVDCTEFVL